MACVRCDFCTGGGNGGEGAGASGGAKGGAAENQPKADGRYAKTKSMLKKLTRAAVAVMVAVLVVSVSSLQRGSITHVS